MDSQVRIVERSDRGQIILTYTPGLANEADLLQWVTAQKESINAKTVERFGKTIRGEFDPEGTAQLTLNFTPHRKVEKMRHSRHTLKNGGALVMDLALPKGAKLPAKARNAFLSHARSFKPVGNTSLDRSSAVHIRDLMLRHGHLSHEQLRNVRYIPPRT